MADLTNTIKRALQVDGELYGDAMKTAIGDRARKEVRATLGRASDGLVPVPSTSNRVYARIEDTAEEVEVYYQPGTQLDTWLAGVIIWVKRRRNRWEFVGFASKENETQLPGNIGAGNLNLAPFWVARAFSALPEAYVIDDVADGLLKHSNGVPAQAVVSTDYLAPNTGTNVVNTAMIADNAITNAKMADNAVNTAEIAANAVTTAKIADSNVTTAKIADSNVTTAKIADSNVTTAKIADSNVTTAKIADANVTTVKILDANITNAKLATDAVTQAKIANDAVGTAEIIDANVTNAKIASMAASKLTGQVALENGGTEADLSATGGANQFVKQSSAGAAFTVGTIGSSDLTTALTTAPPITTSKLVVTGDYSQVGAVTVTSTSADTTLMSASLQWAANFFTAGRQVLVRLSGYANTATNHQIIWRFKLNTATIISAATATTTSGSDVSWHVEFQIGCATTGAPGTGRAQSWHALSTAYRTTTSNATFSLDTTQALDVDITGRFLSVGGSGTPSMTCTNLFLQVIG